MVADDPVGRDQRRLPVGFRRQDGDSPAPATGQPAVHLPDAVTGEHIGMHQHRDAVAVAAHLAQQLRQQGVEPPERRSRTPGGRDDHEPLPVLDSQCTAVCLAAGLAGHDPVDARISHHMSHRKRFRAGPGEFLQVPVVRVDDRRRNQPSLMQQVPATQHPGPSPLSLRQRGDVGEQFDMSCPVRDA